MTNTDNASFTITDVTDTRAITARRSSGGTVQLTLEARDGDRGTHRWRFHHLSIATLTDEGPARVHLWNRGLGGWHSADIPAADIPAADLPADVAQWAEDQLNRARDGRPSDDD